MIDEEATFKAFGYYPRDLKAHSHKPVLAVCDNCGRVRKTSKHDYHALCKLCAMKGRIFTEEWKVNISAALKGKKRKALTEEHKAKISKNHADVKGKNNPSWNGGKKVANARARAKHRKLGHTLIYPVEEGEHSHHFTNEHVGGIPADVHNSLGGRRKKHRTRVLQWLKANDKYKYKMVLCVLAKELSIYGSKY